MELFDKVTLMTPFCISSRSRLLSYAYLAAVRCSSYAFLCYAYMHISLLLYKARRIADNIEGGRMLDNTSLSVGSECVPCLFWRDIAVDNDNAFGRYSFVYVEGCLYIELVTSLVFF